MPFDESGNIRFYTFESLEHLNLVHAIFTRSGGVSRMPYSSLNLGGTVGDDPSLVRKNREMAFSSVDLSPGSIFDVWQVHGNNVVCADKPRPNNQLHEKADAILTDLSGVTLFMRFADCVPILLFDPTKSVIGIAHAGWKGTVQRTAAQTVKTMRERYGSKPANILAAIGPSIGPHHYEIGPAVELEVKRAFGQNASAVLDSGNRNGTGVNLDLWAANEIILRQAGVKNIEIAAICTACHLEDWYSHRAEGGRTGRFGALIALQSD